MSSSAAGTGSADLAREDPAPVGDRVHRVTAVLVTHNGARWLPRVLSSLAESERRPDRLVAVDTGSTDDTRELLDAGPVDDVVEAGSGTSFGAAVQAGLASAVELDGMAPDTIDLRDDHRGRAAVADAIDWVWLLHDDSAPAPDALGELLRVADRLPGAQVIGAKLRSWRHPEVLQECGLALSGAGRPETGVSRGEVDQGQLDGRIDVMAVASAGMLVRRSLWDRLGGFGAAFRGEGADTDFCWRARRADARVVVAPRAVVFHRRAATNHRREVTGRRGSVRYNHRRTAVVTALVHAPLWRLPFTTLRTALGGLFRFLLGLVTLSPRRAWDELTGTAVGVLSWRRILSARHAAAGTASIPARELRHLRPTFAQRMVHWQELVAHPQVRTAATGTPVARRAGRLARLVLLVGGILGVVCLIAGWGLWFGSGRIAGGALLPAPDTMGDLAASFLAPWHEVGLGSDGAAPPYLAVLAALSAVFLGSATMAVQSALLAAPVFAGLSTMLALRGLVRRPVLVAAGLAYGLAPVLLAAVDTGRLGTAVAAVLLPLTARLLVRISGFTTPLPPGNRRTVVAAALMVATVGAFVPPLAICLVMVATAGCLLGRQPRGAARMVLIALVTIALLWPWSGSLLADPGRLLLEIGAQPGRSAVEQATFWQLGLFNPGGPAAAPGYIAAALAALALLALVPRRTRHGVVVAWSVILAGLLLAALQTLVAVPVSWSERPVQPWPGPGTLLMTLGAVTAVAMAATSLPLHRASGRVVIAAFLVAPVMAGAWWVAEGDSLVRREEPGVVSPFVAVASVGSEAPRSLALEQRPDGTVTYRLLSGVGPRIGDADVAPDLDTVARFSSAVSRMASGSGAALDEIAQAAVRFVTLDIERDRALARQLDAVPGLRRVSTIDGQGLWEVAEPVARARVVTPDAVTPIAADVTGAGLSATGTLPEGATTVEVGDRPSGLWRAVVGATELAAAPDGNVQTFEVPAGTTGEVVVAVDRTPRLAMLAVPLLALGLLVVAAMRGTPIGNGAPPPARRATESAAGAPPAAGAELEVVR